MKVRDIEINTLKLDVNFILENNSVVENCLLHSGDLSDDNYYKNI
jgi:pyruvate carboxylase